MYVHVLCVCMCVVCVCHYLLAEILCLSVNQKPNFLVYACHDTSFMRCLIIHRHILFIFFTWI
ncbi:hypothetical protein O6H91_04G030600 [Diphasiastrum complanatum]|uniref:Uncharacterized protein n=1 Tax=Diphasiastrum complanatum TaxID=34168 RepID=A0ACC2DVJ9_DIPCM|nr:hypothetical protein O6H91_04G030600 [Diphasiastrum complanatum]